MTAGSIPSNRLGWATALFTDAFWRWLRILLSAVGGAVVGWTAWGRSENIEGLVGILALPLLWSMLRTKWEALVLMMAYFMAGARGLPDGAVVFFGDTAPHWWGAAMWWSASLLLSAPFALCWSATTSRRALGFGLALLVCLAPPLGIVGWLSPLTVAGTLFPAAGWGGLFLALALLIALAAGGRTFPLSLALAAAAIGNASAVHPGAQAPARWQGFDTNFAQLASGSANQSAQLLSSMQRINWLTRVVAEMPEDATLVLPETLLGRYDGLSQNSLSQAQEDLRAKNSKVLVGAELPLASGRYKNAVVVLGASPGDDWAAYQGIPVPVSMWKPWANDGAEADLLARSNTIMVDGQRIGVSVCYEHLLTYSLLRLMADKPDLIAAVSNVWWARTTNIPTIQSQSVHAFARLFNVPVVFAKNI